MIHQVDVSVLRPDDLLNLEIASVNMRLDSQDRANPALVVDDAEQPALLVVRFPAQTTFEEAFFDSSAALTPEQKLDPPAGCRAAGRAAQRRGQHHHVAAVCRRSTAALRRDAGCQSGRWER